MKTLFVIAFTSVVINGALAQSFNLGPCPKVNTVENFDIERYSGLWYEYERSFLMIFELGGKCVTANYSANSDGTVNVVNSQISSITGSESSITGTARVDDEACNNTTCGKLIVTFPMPVIGEVDGTYWVLETDYTSYSVVWSCTDYKVIHASYAWVLTRDRNPSEAVVQQTTNLYANNNPEFILMTKTNQENC
ncbi:hypothetical protein G9C98_005944 [Cotesia typhae]|uniref:Apolipoprotein D n=1 Tax=Cotesia typhae TaxID=2053667 RepID=A0A8J5R3N0_9HYME|nr:hypothetical protein G9C98_005944 [Cotesia typhae]